MEPALQAFYARYRMSAVWKNAFEPTIPIRNLSAFEHKWSCAPANPKFPNFCIWVFNPRACAWLVSPRSAYKRQRVWFTQQNGQLHLGFITQFLQFCFVLYILTIRFLHFGHWRENRKIVAWSLATPILVYVYAENLQNHAAWAAWTNFDQTSSSWHVLTWNVPKPPDDAI